jgi:hypothetical protein
MVIVEINSGLGNQMFKYAAGRALADFLQVQLKLDISWFETAETAQTPNKYQLDKFPGISEPIASREEIDNLIRPSSVGIFNKIRHKINRNRPIHNQWAFVEPHFHYYDKFWDARSPVYLTGYWQSEKYFFNIKENIHSVFSTKIQNSPENIKMANHIADLNAVSLHVRRGDMVSNPLVVASHGSAGLDYYYAAMKLIENRVRNPHYFVFSDDLDWCESNIKSDFPLTFVDCNTGLNSYLDIQLMRLCKHQIIPNSTFSWWGAWLNTSKDKIVIAPKKWFPTNDKNTNDLIPESWIRI